MFSLIIKTIFILTSWPALFQAGVLNEASFQTVPQEINFPYSLGPEITAQSALVVDLKTGEVCWEKNKEQILSIASITKLMTSLVFLEHYQGDWEQEVIIKEEDLIKNFSLEDKLRPVVLNLKPGEKIKIKDLFTAGLIRSANDAMMVLGRIVETSNEKTFVNLMNEKAKELGMKNTFFDEPTGLSINNRSTAEDLLKLVVAALKEEKISQSLEKAFYDFSLVNIQGTRNYFRVWNTNEVLNSFVDLKWAKTGYLKESGYCFVGLSNYQEGQFVVIVLNSLTNQDRWQEIKSLVWWSQSHCQNHQSW